MENLRELTVTVNTSTCKYWEQDDGTHHRPGVCCVVSGFDSSDVKMISESEWKLTLHLYYTPVEIVNKRLLTTFRLFSAGLGVDSGSTGSVQD